MTLKIPAERILGEIQLIHLQSTVAGIMPAQPHQVLRITNHAGKKCVDWNLDIVIAISKRFSRSKLQMRETAGDDERGGYFVLHIDVKST